jgi:PAS domain S-box-containing protein
MSTAPRPADRATAARLLSLATAMLALLAIIVGLGVRNALLERARGIAETALLSFAEIKHRELQHWLRDLQIKNMRPTDGALANAIAARQPGDDTQALQQRLAWLVQRSDEFRAAWLLDRNGVTLAATDPRAVPALPPALVEQIAAGRTVALTDFYLDASGRPALATVTPLRRDDDADHALTGFLVIEVDPAYALYPLLQGGHPPDLPLETFLARREGHAVRYLNPLSDAPRPLHLQIADPSARLLAMHEPDGTRVVEAEDYRGVPVLGVVRHIPEMSWIIATKMDVDAIHAAARAEFNAIAARLGGVGALVLLLLWFAIRHTRTQGELRQMSAELERARLESHRQAAAAALARSEARFRGFFELAMVGLAQLSAERRWMEVNPALCDILGRDRDTLLDTAWTQIVHPDDLAAEDARFHDILAGRCDDYHLTLRFVTAHGRIVWGSVAVRALRDADGRVEYLVLIVEDISFLKEREAQLHRALDEQIALNGRLEETRQQLLQSEKMAAIGQLAAGVAHEINNPVGFVSSNMSTLGQYLDGLLAIGSYARERLGADPALAALLQTHDFDFVRDDAPALVHESLEGLGRVRKIVQDLRDFSRVGESDWQWADVHHGLDSTLNIVWNEIKYKAELRKEYGVLPQIWCLPSQLNQVFLNLLVNAAHAIADHGVITVRTAAGADGVWIEVEDTGCGIAPEHLGKLFDPFFTTKPVGQGTGLGLSLAFSIVRKHQGRIEVRSVPGQGACFRIILPTLSPNTPAAANTAPRHEEMQK